MEYLRKKFENISLFGALFLLYLAIMTFYKSYQADQAAQHGNYAEASYLLIWATQNLILFFACLIFIKFRSYGKKS